MKQYTNAIIFGIAIVASSIFLGKAYTDRSKADGEIRVTGLELFPKYKSTIVNE